MSYRLLALCLPLFAGSAWAARPAVITHKPAKHVVDGRPSVTKASISTSGDDFVLALTYDQVPVGPACKEKCARSVFLIDTDADSSTGLQQGRGKPGTGADLAVFLDGMDDSGAVQPQPYLRAVVRQYSDEDRTLEDGDVVAQLDQRKDEQRVRVKGTIATVKVDASSTTIPSAKTCRFIYLAPGTKPLAAPCTGIVRSSGSQAKIDRGAGTSTRSRSRSQGGGVDVQDRAPVGAPKDQPDPIKVDSRWGSGG